MKKHKYIRKNSNDSWMVKCLETDGEFSTIIWDRGYSNRKCPCCNQEVTE